MKPIFFAAFLRRIRSDVGPVQQHTAARRVVQPRHERRRRGLAAAGRPDESVGLAAFQSEAAVAQDLLSAGIAEVNLVEFQNTGRRVLSTAAGITGMFDSSASTSEIRSSAASASWNDDHSVAS